MGNVDMSRASIPLPHFLVSLGDKDGPGGAKLYPSPKEASTTKRSFRRNYGTGLRHQGIAPGERCSSWWTLYQNPVQKAAVLSHHEGRARKLGQSEGSKSSPKIAPAAGRNTLCGRA
jgi:hypothetical protein